MKQQLGFLCLHYQSGRGFTRRMEGWGKERGTHSSVHFRSFCAPFHIEYRMYIQIYLQHLQLPLDSHINFNSICSSKVFIFMALRVSFFNSQIFSYFLNEISNHCNLVQNAIIITVIIVLRIR